MEICSKNICTGCGACAYVCPKKCISMNESEIGVIYPVVDTNECINCGKCKRNCPSLLNNEYKYPQKAYAAWHKDDLQRRTSASGGVASALYELALNSNIWPVGAKMNEDFSVDFAIAKNGEECIPFKNSKYVFSSMYSVYEQIEEKLKANEKVLVIALPCQISAIKTLFGDFENLFCVDLICHGTTPLSYLKQHINGLEEKYGKTAVAMSFRDAKAKTTTFTFTLYDKSGECFYAKRTKDGDTYQIGYHRAISYRENCYNCRYAKQERVSDLTLGDYWGLGRLAPWKFKTDEVSSILVNTEKGEKLILGAVEQKLIEVFQRPIEEVIKYNSQLKQAIRKSKTRLDFEKCILKTRGDFEKTMRVCIKKNSVRERFKKALHIPRRVAGYLKRKILRG